MNVDDPRYLQNLRRQFRMENDDPGIRAKEASDGSQQGHQDIRKIQEELGIQDVPLFYCPRCGNGLTLMEFYFFCGKDNVRFDVAINGGNIIVKQLRRS